MTNPVYGTGRTGKRGLRLKTRKRYMKGRFQKWTARKRQKS